MFMDNRKPKLSRADMVYEYLKEQILSLQLKPKDAISESRICNETGASRTPVREAIGHLVHEELLYVLPQRGTFVAPIYIDKFLEAHFVRTAIEIAILKEANKNWSASFSREALGFIEMQEVAMNEQDHDTFYEKDHEFHHTFAKAAGMMGVTGYIDQTRSQLARVRSLIVSKSGHMESVISEHRSILAAIDSGDIDQTIQNMHYHLDTLYTTLGKLQEEYGSFFAEKQ